MNGVKNLDILREIIENNVDNLPLNQMIRTIWQHDGARITIILMYQHC